jgi:cytochrome c551/c552
MAEFGCTICHDGQGSATEFKFASHSPNDLAQRAQWREAHGWSRDPGWDFPMRPRRFAESNCLKCHHDVTDLEPGRRFPDPPAPKLLAGYHLVRQYGCFGCHEIKGIGPAGEHTGPDMRLAPGTMPKVGPSLRSIADKLDAATLQAWIDRPAGLRPNTHMPQFFGMHEHLEQKGLDEARRFEPVEVRAVAEYLLAKSRPVAPLPAPPAVTESPSAHRGKRLFLLHGCLACHRHADFPEGQATQGPDLSQLGAKLGTPSATAWLASWIRDPARHWPHTLMPNPLLTPEPLPDGADNGRRKTTDPAADIAAYLAGSTGIGRPKLPAPLREPDLDALALLYLTRTFPTQTAEQILRDGIPASASNPVTSSGAQGDATELAAPVSLEKKLHYVGRQTIRKRGCFGCHDIPGFEDAEPIGPALSDWGRKPESLLAFEQVHRFLEQGLPSPASGEGQGVRARCVQVGESMWDGRTESPSPQPSPKGRGDAESDADRGFYLDAVRTQRREGFLWQKLRAPRSFDYLKTAHKGYNEQLLMARFSFTPAEREAIITFVLGLVAEAPKEKYLPRPEPRRRAIVEGRKVLDKYACAQCHTLEMERWTIERRKGEGGGMKEGGYATTGKGHLPLSSFLLPPSSLTLVGMPQRTAQGALDETEDEDGKPLYAFTLWEPVTIGGKVWPVGGASVLVAPGQIVHQYPPRGGDFARLLLPAAIAEAKAAGSTAGPQEAWGWVPPPLVHTGRALQPAWLHDYLLEPDVIRPASVLRMPKYNLSPEEAAKLVDYFAAAAGTDFPLDSRPRGRAPRPAGDRPAQAPPWEKAFRLVTDQKTFCAKCHLVGDWRPGGPAPSAGWSGTVLAPNLERVAARIRPDYLRRWIANPKGILPYTPMPVNFPVDETRGQDLLSGTSAEQLDAVCDFLLNYDTYLIRRTSVREWMRGEIQNSKSQIPNKSQ